MIETIVLILEIIGIKPFYDEDFYNDDILYFEIKKECFEKQEMC